MENLFGMFQIGTTIHYIILLVGFVLGFILYEKFGTRVGGVLAIPLAVVYCLAELKLIPVLIVATLMTSLIGYLIFRTFLIYGRRMLYIYAGTSIFFTIPLILLIGAEATVFMSIIPGLLAYNLHREMNSSGPSSTKRVPENVVYCQIVPGLRSFLNWWLENGRPVGSALLFFSVLYGIGRFLMWLPTQQAIGLSVVMLTVSFIWLGYETKWLTIRLPGKRSKRSIS